MKTLYMGSAVKILMILPLRIGYIANMYCHKTEILNKYQWEN